MSTTIVLLLSVLLPLCQRTSVSAVILPKGAPDNSPLLLVVSYDSFNNKYFDFNVTPNLKKIQADGVSVPYLRNVFTTKTFPNHFSIATGLYPGRHGVTNNLIFDHKLKKAVGYGYEYYHQSEETTPIWTLNEEQGGHSSCICYPGTNFKYHNRSCTYTEVYSHGFDFQKRVDLAFKHMQSPKNPANLVMLYFEQPDDFAHKYGPNSEEVKGQVAHVDQITGYIMEAVKKNKLESRLNVIFMSDHGMAEMKLSNMIDLHQTTDPSTYDMYGSSPVVQVVPKPGQFDNVLNSLKESAKTLGHFNVYENKDLPERWHYQNTDRVGPITIVSDTGYIFNEYVSVIEYFANINVTKTNDIYGLHGFDNSEALMWAVFMGKGPALKAKFMGQPVDNIDLFHLFCKILKLKAPQKLDGNPKNIEQFLADSTKARSGETRWSILGIPLIIGLLIVSTVVVITLVCMRFKRNRKRSMRRHRARELDAAFDDVDDDAETAQLIRSHYDDG